ncbi:hypothetical protein CN918_31885 [Priestia megaterium]|nr:hypothetical protein CN918_31885 [Priestia megaterium]
MKNFKILYFFCEEFIFKKGVWVGRFRFTVEVEHISYEGALHISYKQSTPVASIQKRYTFRFQKVEWGIDIVNAIKAEIEELFLIQFEVLNSTFVAPREKHMPPPTIIKFVYNKKVSTELKWVFTFSLKEAPAAKFQVEMTLEGNTWYYTIHALNGSLVEYKTSLQWEDSLIEQVASHIKLVPEIRYQFLYQKMKFRYRKSYR